MGQWFRELRCRLSGHRFGAYRSEYVQGAMFAKAETTCERCGFVWRQLRYPPGSEEDRVGMNEALTGAAWLRGTEAGHGFSSMPVAHWLGEAPHRPPWP